jgi:hypothetical protein
MCRCNQTLEGAMAWKNTNGKCFVMIARAKLFQFPENYRRSKMTIGFSAPKSMQRFRCLLTDIPDLHR